MITPQLADLFLARFVSGGRGERGRDGALLFDCWGLVMAAHARFNAELPDFHVDAADTAGKSAAYHAEKRSGRWVRLARPETPCLVVLSTCTNAPEACNHFGTYIGGGSFLHAFRPCSAADGSGVRLDRVDEHPWPARIQGFWRWAG